MDVSDLIQNINHIAASPKSVKPEQRTQLLSAIGNCQNALETPYEFGFKTLLATPQAIMLRLGVDMKLFDAANKIAEDGGAVTAEALAVETSTEKFLAARVMRVLVAMNIFKQLDKDVYEGTDASKAYISGSLLAEGVIHMTWQLKAISQLPDYFEENGYKCPTDGYHGPLQYAMKTQLHSFEWLATKPKLQHAFNTIMQQMPRQNRSKPWHQVFPVESKLLVDSDTDPLLVDIGGGGGHTLIDFKKNHPNLKGRLILQEIPVVIDSVKDLPPEIEAMKYSFFDPQPVKGARAYFLANVVHDWPDKQAKQILGNIKDAMSSDSKLLILENVLPETNVPLYSAIADWIMMASHAALERTQEQFESLINEAGFKLLNIWSAEGTSAGSEKLFEAVPK